MNQDCVDAGVLRGLHYAQDGIAKEPRTDAFESSRSSTTRERNAELPGRGSHGAIGGPQLRLGYYGRREQVQVDPTEAGTPKAAGFQQMTDLRFRGNRRRG